MWTRPSRRELLCRAWNGLGALALAGLVADDVRAAANADPLTPKPQHFPRKAKHCIFLFMGGGVSQVDTFEHKPALSKYAGKRLPKVSGLSGEMEGFLAAEHQAIPTQFEFKQHGQSGRWMSSLFPELAQCADHLAFVHGIKVDNNNHAPATFHVNCGSQFQGNPSVGAWITYGLGSINQNLPGYIVIQDQRGAPMNGSSVWGAGYLPASQQGTLLRSAGSPILDLDFAEDVTRAQQRKEFDILRTWNERHLAARPGASELEARISAYELAFRMQVEAPSLVDLSSESTETAKLYGLDNPVTAGFGRQCMLARRLVERGVRFTLLTHGPDNGKYSWDDHGNIMQRIPHHCVEVDRPVAALLKDLEQRSLLDETLVVWASEMGRTPFINDLKTDKPGRDHNQYGLVMWLAGGDVKGGTTVGETDEFGIKSIAEPIPIRDVHATILDLLGISDERLTYLHDGRFRRLTDIGGRVLRELYV